MPITRPVQASTPHAGRAKRAGPAPHAARPAPADPAPKAAHPAKIAHPAKTAHPPRDSHTRHAARAAKAKPVKAGRPASDTEALVRAVAAEARGEGPAVWAAVAQTIINYARRSGRAIHRVVRSSYLSSNFDRNRPYYTMPLSRIPKLEGIRQAVAVAQAGQSPVGGRTHFHDVSIDTPKWGDRDSRMPIGRMVFFDPK